MDFDRVKDTADQTSFTKQVLPVSSATEVGPARQIERGGNVDTTNRSRAALQPFADEFFYGNGGENQGKRMTLAQAADILNKKRSFNAALLLGRINMKSPIGNFLRLFPEKFKIDGNYLEVLSSTPAPAPAVARNPAAAPTRRRRQKSTP